MPYSQDVPQPGAAARSPRLGIAAVALLLLCAGCGGSDDGATARFAFRLRGAPASEEFRAGTSSPAVIAQARAQLARPVAERNLFASGRLRAGNGGHNLAWSWHLEEFGLVEASIELCDGRPSMVEADLDYWINTVGFFCPWGSYVHAELR